jgi:hypothetical protein
VTTFSTWYAATGCTGSARPGARALMAYVLQAFPRATNLGIYNCRNARGTTTFSPHAEGRAIDVGFPLTSNGRGSSHGYALVNALLKAGPSRLGIQAIIYDRKIWSAKTPGGRPYTGVHPHYDHVHVEMTRKAANEVTLATVRAVLAPATTGSKYETYKRGVKAGSRTIGQFKTRPWSAGDDVKEVQRILNAWYPRAPRLALDGYFGPKTTDRIKTLQTRARLDVDGIVGPKTWRTLNVR